MNSKVKVLADVTNYIARGITPSYDEKGVLVINQKCIRDQLVNLAEARITNPTKKKITEKKFIRRYDVLVNSTGVGTLGRVAQIKNEPIKPITADSHVTIVRPDQKMMDGLYFGYAMINAEPQITFLGEGSTGQIELSRKRLASEIEIKVHPLPIQKKIASILSSVDAKIHINHEMNQTLEAIGQAIFRHWFVHYEFPNEDGQPYKSSGGEMVDSELGEIPVGWEVRKLKDSSNITMGQSPKSEFYNTEGEGLPFHQGVTNFGDRFPKDKMYCTVENKVAECGDILFSVRAPVGRINIAKSKIVIGRGLSAIRHKNGFQSFLLYQLKNIFTEEDSIGSGTVFNAITRKDLDDLLVINPNKELDKLFNDFASPLEKQIENLALENDYLAKIRDLILPKLMMGKIRILDDYI